ncbi:MAG: hypothetical protein FWB95_01985 [Treponema sp.]|nr:hypothetical protein [Treponema sp.]
MIQLYVLSILCCGISGFILFTGNDEGNDLPSPVNTPTSHLVLGIISAVTGILKLLSPLPSSMNAARGIIILGDLIPCAAGIVAGLILIFGLYRRDISAKDGELDRIGTKLLVFRKPIGIALMCAALVHFIFGELLFL